MLNVNLQQGNCLELMKDIPDGSIDAVITDPPYEHVTGGIKNKKYNVGSWKANSYMNMKMSQFKHDDLVLHEYKFTEKEYKELIKYIKMNIIENTLFL